MAESFIFAFKEEITIRKKINPVSSKKKKKKGLSQIPDQNLICSRQAGVSKGDLYFPL